MQAPQNSAVKRTAAATRNKQPLRGREREREVVAGVEDAKREPAAECQSFLTHEAPGFQDQALLFVRPCSAVAIFIADSRAPLATHS